ncbi:MAG TPA: TolC family protein [Steroidobacteraceae bacterium]|jgi:outer membrane protein TolC|nr:TolC family protein [Steroidobacteraceae bacterium]
MDRFVAGPLLAGALLAGCVTQPYRPAPLAADESASAFESRSFADPGLRAFEAAHLDSASTPWPPATWNLQTLSLAALYFNPKLAEARARFAESQAELTTAGARPNPTLGITPGVPSPYLLTLDLSFPIETAGKRRYRLEAARSSAQASQLDLAETAWTIRGAVRAALIDYLIAGRNLDLLRSETEARAGQVKLLEHMSSLGEISSPETDNARIEWSKTRAALGAAEEQCSEAKAGVAAAIGIPASALENLRISWPEMSSPPALESLPLAKIRREAVLNRLNLRSSLAQYAAAEARLKLEIARQYPDVDIGPGYTYEERHSYFTLGLAAVIPVFDRNRGPIAEAQAQREQAAAAFLATQSQVIQRSDRSLAIYAVALKELADAQQLVDLTERRRRAVSAAVRAGEQGRLELYDSEVEHSVAARARLEALARAQRALGELEDVVERPLAAGDELPGGATDPARWSAN